VRHRRALAARQDQGVDCFEIGREPDGNAFDLTGAQRRQVLPEIPLQRKDADAARTSQSLVRH
jgi:hypothetical protein